jgi:hypothetical protein
MIEKTSSTPGMSAPEGSRKPENSNFKQQRLKVLMLLV